MTLKSTVLLLLAGCSSISFLCFCIHTRIRNPKVAQAEVAKDVVRTTSMCVRV